MKKKFKKQVNLALALTGAFYALSGYTQGLLAGMRGYELNITWIIVLLSLTLILAALTVIVDIKLYKHFKKEKDTK